MYNVITCYLSKSRKIINAEIHKCIYRYPILFLNISQSFSETVGLNRIKLLLGFFALARITSTLCGDMGL